MAHTLHEVTHLLDDLLVTEQEIPLEVVVELFILLPVAERRLWLLVLLDVAKRSTISSGG
jgi:hypothetical protein